MTPGSPGTGIRLLRRRLGRVNNLRAFDQTLDQCLADGGGETVRAYLAQIQPVILHLTMVYRKRGNLQAAYFAWFLNRHRLNKYMQMDTVQDVLVDYMENSGIREVKAPDLDVIRVEDNYYMVSTTMHLSPGMPIMKSKDLVNWEIVNYCYDILDDSDELSSETEKKHMETEHGPQASSIMTANSMYLHPARQLRKPMYSQPQTLRMVCGRNRFWTVIITTCPFFLTIRRTGLTFICLQAPVPCM